MFSLPCDVVLIVVTYSESENLEVSEGCLLIRVNNLRLLNELENLPRR